MRPRRRFLLLLAGAFAAKARAQQAPLATVARRRMAMEEAVREVTGGAEVRAGRVRIEMPPLIDNGNTVPLAVSVESPMTPQDHVQAIHIFVETNPQPRVLSVFLGPRAGRARVETRARIGESGGVLALAQTSDGRYWSERAEAIVTLPACVEESVL